MATISEALAIARGHHQAGRLQEAEVVYRQILGVDPNQADALHLLGVIASQVGHHEFAVTSISRAIELKGTEAAFHNNLGIALKDVGRLEQAVEAYRRAIELNPDYAEAHCNLGLAHHMRGAHEEAVTCLRRALEINPQLFEVYSNLGAALTAQGKVSEAIECYRLALELNPRYVGAHNNLGTALLSQGKLSEAIAAYERAVELRPDIAVGHRNLGAAAQAQGEVDRAIACYHQALTLNPNDAEAYYNLGTAMQAHGDVEEAIANYRKSLELRPDYALPHSNLLLALHYRTGATLSDLAASHAEFQRRQEEPLRQSWRPHFNDRDSNRLLRLGFVSEDFGQHPVGFFLVRVLENLDRDQCQTVCYSDRPEKDQWTARFEAAATSWREVRGRSDQELAETIRDDRIDILFDLAGHTRNNRLFVFARKPAPIQVTWAGYAGTTGLKAIDFILADRYEIPVGAEAFYSERVLRMPDGYVCYEPPVYAPAVSPLPALEQGFVTFGSFNTPPKITTTIVKVWAKILNRVPESRLILKFRGMSDSSVTNKLWGSFAQHGVDASRVLCLGWSPQIELLAEYGRIDVALDPIPYSGGLTTCESLWMGVPVITCPGETFASRHSLSHLSNVGLTETIAGDLEEYVELAVKLANDLPRLGELRRGLRERMAASPLCDGKRFADNLMRVLRGVWREWCASTFS